MRAPVLMLAWEIWRRNYKYVCLSLGTIPCYLLFYWAILSQVHAAGTRVGLSSLWMFFSLFWVLATFNYTEVNAGKGWTGFPHRLFVLPVPTVVLAWLPMLLGMASMALGYLVWTRLIFVPLGLQWPETLWPAGLLAMNLACFQAVIWTLPRSRITRTFVLVLVGFAALAFDESVLAFYKSTTEAEVPIRLFRNGLFILATVGLGLSALVGAWFSLAWQRRGGGRGWLKGRFRALIERIIDAWPGSKKPFASPLAAQFWFEWRGGGMLLPVCVGAVLLLFLGPVCWLNRWLSFWADQKGVSPEATQGILCLILFMPFLLAFGISKGFAKPEFWSMDLTLKPFLAVRPLTAGEMVVTKMKVAALSTVLTWLLVLAALPLWYVLWVDRRTVHEFSEIVSKSGVWDWLQTHYSPFARYAIPILIVVAAMVLTWRSLVGSLWVGLSGSWRYVVSSAAVHGVVVIGSMVALAHAKEFSWNQLQTVVGWLGWTLAVAVILKLWLAVFFWNKVSRHHLGSEGGVPWLLAWAGGTACLVALAWLSCPYVVWLRYQLVLGALLSCPLARLGIAPLSLARNRHR